MKARRDKKGGMLESKGGGATLGADPFSGREVGTQPQGRSFPLKLHDNARRSRALKATSRCPG